MRRRSWELPDLKHDYRDALIKAVELGPGSAMTLVLRPVVREGQQGRYDKAVRVRFSAMKNGPEVAAFFGTALHESSELARMGYAPDRPSKPGRLFVELLLERTDARLVVQCGNVTVSGAD